MLQQSSVVDVLAGSRMQSSGFLRSKAKLQKDIGSRFCDVANFSIDHFFTFLSLITLR